MGLATAIALSALVVCVLVAPIYRYLCVGWQAKRDDIMDSMSAEARLAYFRMFARNKAYESADDASAAFELAYQKWFGQQFYYLPLGLLICVSATLVFAAVCSALDQVGYLHDNPFIQLPLVALAAISGAYMWVVNDFTSRARRLDFSPSDLHWGTLRLTIAIPMGYAFAGIAAQNAGAFVAFALGAFPLTALTSMMRKLSQKYLETDQESLAAKDNIIVLQGVNQEVFERLAGEDIATVAQMAYCDPVRLTMRSNLSFNFVTDCMNQALAWLYLEEKLSLLRPLGLRGAVEIKHFIEELDASANDDHHRAKAALPEIAKALGQTAATLEIVLREIAEDPFTDYLSEAWNDTAGDL